MAPHKAEMAQSSLGSLPVSIISSAWKSNEGNIVHNIKIGWNEWVDAHVKEVVFAFAW